MQKKICLISSSGGHFEQLMMLKKLGDKNDIFVVTEKTKYNKNSNKINYYISQVNRKELLLIPKLIKNFLKSLFILIKEKPNVIISTGALATIPMIFLGHLFKKKIIYIESFAKTSSPTMTGKLIYKKKWANQFYVQWEKMLEFYPDAIYKGGIY